jgi:hypothetical protein
MEICALCLEEKALVESHVIPAFVVRFLKDTSATGYIRDPLNPNRRLQDAPTKKLLCTECENRFSKWERTFSRESFPEIQEENFKGFQYSADLLKFAVSLSWRVLTVNKESVLEAHPQFATVVNAKLEDWRLYLLDQRNNPGGEHHLFVFGGLPIEAPPGVHHKSLHYMFRTNDGTVAASARRIAVYTKLMRSVFWSPLIPAKPSGWHKTRIHAGTGYLASKQTISMNGFGDFLETRVEEAFRTPYSDRQVQKIAETMRKNPERVLASETSKVHKVTRELWVNDNEE